MAPTIYPEKKRQIRHGNKEIRHQATRTAHKFSININTALVSSTNMEMETTTSSSSSSSSLTSSSSSSIGNTNSTIYKSETENSQLRNVIKIEHVSSDEAEQEQEEEFICATPESVNSSESLASFDDDDDDDVDNQNDCEMDVVNTTAITSTQRNLTNMATKYANDDEHSITDAKQFCCSFSSVSFHDDADTDADADDDRTVSDDSSHCSKTYSDLCEIKNTEGLLSIAIKTIKLVKRNQLLQQRLAQLQMETSEFIQSVLANPENRHFRQKIQQQKRRLHKLESGI